MIVQTRNTRYVLIDRGDSAYTISGSAKYCPRPTNVRLLGEPVVGDSMRWVYEDETHPHWSPHGCIRTSEILSIDHE